MVAFDFALSLVLSLRAREPENEQQAPRAIALEISKAAADEREAALLAFTAWQESRFVPNAVGDHGRALCAYQLQHAPSAVLRDLRLCTRLGLRRLRDSAARCPSHPMAYYTAGRCDVAHKISDLRMAEVGRLLGSGLP